MYIQDIGSRRRITGYCPYRSPCGVVRVWDYEVRGMRLRVMSLRGSGMAADEAISKD